MDDDVVILCGQTKYEIRHVMFMSVYHEFMQSVSFYSRNDFHRGVSDNLPMDLLLAVRWVPEEDMVSEIYG